MTRQEAYQTLQLYTKSQTLIRHHLAVEAAMRAVAKKLISKGIENIDIELWGLTGLLHDADYEITRKNPERHTLYLEEKLGKTLPPGVIQAIKSHNSKHTNTQPQTPMDWALFCVDELTGFVIKTAMLTNDKRIASLSSDGVILQINDKSNAKYVKKEQILACETQLHIPLKEFVELVLNSMKTVANQLGFTQ